LHCAATLYDWEINFFPHRPGALNDGVSANFAIAGKVECNAARAAKFRAGNQIFCQLLCCTGLLSPRERLSRAAVVSAQLLSI